MSKAITDKNVPATTAFSFHCTLLFCVIQRKAQTLLVSPIFVKCYQVLVETYSG